MNMIENVKFEGNYAPLFVHFIEHKKSLGYQYNSHHCRSIRRFNDYLEKTSSDCTTLTKADVEGFVEKQKGEQWVTQLCREGIARQFAMFMDSLNYEAYVLPKSRKAHRSNFIPYIYTKDQISAIFRAADAMAYSYRSAKMHVFYPFLLRLLYGCGLRISEALNLKLDDIDMSERVIRIEQAKNNNSRLIPLSPSLADALNRYLEQMQYERGYKGFLFVNQHGKPYRSNTVLTRFKRLLAQAGIPARENGRTPRLHDLRHTFAVHSLDQMVENGMDAYCVLPYLSTYMGHRNISCTEQYLRLTNQSFRHITAATEPMYTGLFPRGGAE